VGPTTSVPQTIHQQAFIPQISTTLTHLRDVVTVPQTIHQEAPTQRVLASTTHPRDILTAPTLAPTPGFLVALLMPIQTNKEHPTIQGWIHILDQLPLIRQTHISSTQNYLKTISLRAPRCLRKAMRIRQLVGVRSSLRQVVCPHIFPITHPRLHQQQGLVQCQHVWVWRRPLFLEHPYTQGLHRKHSSFTRPHIQTCHTVYLQLAPSQEVLMKFGILTHPHLHQRQTREARRQACNQHRPVFLEHPQTLAFLPLYFTNTRHPKVCRLALKASTFQPQRLVCILKTHVAQCPDNPRQHIHIHRHR
jgi:hypothetical protein